MVPIVVVFSGCGSDPPAPEVPPPTRFSAQISARGDLNLDLNGRPSPVIVKVFELKKATAFDGANFENLFRQPRDALGEDLVASDEILLTPGETRVLEKDAEPGASMIGFAAAFQNIDEALWRAVLPLAPNVTSVFRVDLTKNRLIGEIKPEEPRPESGEDTETEQTHNEKE